MRMARRARAISLSIRMATFTDSTEFVLRKAEATTVLAGFNFGFDAGMLFLSFDYVISNSDR
jgi:hypothetical protein